MPVFTVQIFKLYDLATTWTNRYFVRADNLEDAHASGLLIKEAERDFHKDDVRFTQVRTSDLVVGNDQFISSLLTDMGTAGSAAGFIPFWNCALTSLSAAGGGRPSRKYYRLPLVESEINNGQMTTAVTALIDNALSALISDLTTAGTPLVDPDDQLLGSPATSTFIRLRQMDRRRRPVTAP